MTTYYLTKIEGDQVYHFRVAVEANGVSIVEGRFYHYLLSLFKGIGLPVSQVTEKDKRKVETMAQELVERQLAEGYVITPFVETKENTVQLYDKAQFHYEGNFPEDLDMRQAYVHTGFFLGWLIDRGLINTAYFGGFESALHAFEQRTMTGPQIYETVLGGELGIEALSEMGNRFALDYFDFNSGQYLHDYRHTLSRFQPSVYHVEDNWGNYAAIKAVIDVRYRAWLDSTALEHLPAPSIRPVSAPRKPWWKFW